jgi:phosphate transport system protein
MRTGFHAELDRLSAELGEMCRVAGTLVEFATTALVDADLPAAERVLTELAHLDTLDARVRDRAFALLALQAPVARDLRTVVSALQIAADADRMGGLAANVAKIARRRHPESAVPEPAGELFVEMGSVAVQLANRVESAVITGDVEQARRIRDGDDVMDDLHRRLFGLLTDQRWPHGTAAAADVILLGRFYGRFADHAVEIARRIVFRTTAHPPLHLDADSPASPAHH